VLALTRGWSGRLSQEALIGVLYVVLAAAAFLLIDRAPQGAEHIKQLLVGNILTVTGADLGRLAAVYGAIGALHAVYARRFLLVSREPERARAQGVRVWAWDVAFYASFGVVVTSSVAIAGVLLVFSFLIIPAAIGTLLRPSLPGRLAVGWAAGAGASALGMGLSYAGDLPTGATLVCTFGVALALTGLWVAVRAAATRGVPGPASPRLGRWVTLGRWAGGGAALILLASGAWLSIHPTADQPLLDALEAVAPPVRRAFLTPEEERIVAEALTAAESSRAASGRIEALERSSRWAGQELSNEDLRRLYSYQLSYREMERGERFVQDVLRSRARRRQRWVLGVPAVAVALGVLIWLGWPGRREGVE
jgi:zinc/manganese transport system permease protein